MATVKGAINLSVSGDYGIGSENRSGSVRALVEYVQSFANGTGTNQIDVLWDDRRTILAGANEDLDLSGVLTALEGSAVAFAKVVAILFRNRNTAAGQTIKVGPAAANGWGPAFGAATHRVVIPGSGYFLWIDPGGSAVTAGTGDLLNVEVPGAADVTYDVIVLGKSA
jgi:hypothetical protein